MQRKHTPSATQSQTRTTHTSSHSTAPLLAPTNSILQCDKINAGISLQAIKCSVSWHCTQAPRPSFPSGAQTLLQLPSWVFATPLPNISTCPPTPRCRSPWTTPHIYSHQATYSFPVQLPWINTAIKHPTVPCSNSLAYSLSNAAVWASNSCMPLPRLAQNWGVDESSIQEEPPGLLLLGPATLLEAPARSMKDTLCSRPRSPSVRKPRWWRSTSRTLRPIISRHH